MTKLPLQGAQVTEHDRLVPAVAQLRRRNLGFSFGVVLVLMGPLNITIIALWTSKLVPWQAGWSPDSTRTSCRVR